MAMQMQIQFASIQQGEKLMKIIGLISAPEIAKLMDDVSLKPNPRSPNVNKITRAIDATLDRDPELLQYKTKGVLAAGKYVRRDNAVFSIDFTTPSYGGILDGGHNFFAIVRHMMIEAVKYKYSSMKKEDKKIRSEVEKTRSWKDLIERWQYHGEIVKEFANSVSGLGMSSRFSINSKLAKKFSFLLPIEILSPTNGTTEREVKDIIHEISVARNNNVQLKDVAIAQHKGSYEFLKQVLPVAVNDKVQWKSGENQCPILPTKVVPLTLLPMLKLEQADVLFKIAKAINTTNSDSDEEQEGTVGFPPVKLMSMYTSTAGCVSLYSQVIDAVLNLDADGEDDEGFKEIVVDSLGVLKDLPDLWDTLECSFEDLYSVVASGNDKQYSDLSCNRKGPAKKDTPTRFMTCVIKKGKFVARAGFLTPLFMTMASAFLTYVPNKRKVMWTVDVQRIKNEILIPSRQMKDMLKQFISLIKSMDYDPAKFGKSPVMYDMFGNDYKFKAWVDHVKHN